MSKNITIQEGGLTKQLTANKLKTNLAGGGACLWVRVDDPGVEWPELVQPAGAQYAYNKGAKVSRTQKH